MLKAATSDYKIERDLLMSATEIPMTVSAPWPSASLLLTSGDPAETCSSSFRNVRTPINTYICLQLLRSAQGLYICLQSVSPRQKRNSVTIGSQLWEMAPS